MILRILYLVALLGVIGSDARDEDETRMGGEGFGNVVMLVVGLGALILIAIIVVALLALNGQFDNPNVDPAV
jgi:hypothetical protein